VQTRRVVREHVFRRNRFRIETSLPFLVTVTARANVESHNQNLSFLRFFVAINYGTQARMSSVHTNIESVLQEERIFPPSESFSHRAHIESLAELERLRAEAAADPEAFWARLAEQELHWFKTWDTV